MSKIILALSWITLFLPGNLGERWVDGQNWEDRSHDDDSVIVSRFKEKPLVGKFSSTNTKFVAEAVAVALPMQGEELDRLAAALVKARWGLSENVLVRQTFLSAAWRTNPVAFPEMLSEAREQWSVALQSYGISPTLPCDAYRIRSRPYNIYPARHGNSVTTMLIIDGKSLVKKNCSLLVLYRTDRAEQWGWRSIHEPLSFRYQMRVIDVVTGTERKLLKELLAHQTGSSDLHVLPYASSWYDSTDVWKSFSKTCEQH